MTDPVTSQKSSRLYRRLLAYALNYKTFFAISILGFALFAGMEAVLAMMLEFFINTLEEKPTDKFNFLPAAITASIFFVPVAVVILSVLRGIGTFLGNFYMGRLGLGVVNDLRKQVFAHMIYLPQSFYDKKNSGELVSLIIYNIEQVTGSVTNAVRTLVRDGFSLIAYLILLFYYNWKLTLVFFAVAPILASLIYIASKYFRRVSRKIQTAFGKVTHIATESFQGIKLVKSYGGEHYEKRRFNQAADENLQFSTKFERVSALQTPVLHVVIASSLGVLFFLVLLFWEDTAAAAVVYVSVAGLIAKPFRQLSQVNSIIQRGLAAAETIFTTLDYPPEPDQGKNVLNNIKGRITFNDVSFAYSGSENEVVALDNISFTVAPGTTVALVGGSGSGKTTIANLLLRFYDPASGVIAVDDTPIQSLSLANLRSHIALVNQQTILFNDNVTANIAYGEENDIDTNKVSAAAQNAYANYFIEGMSEGFDTLIGEDGARLSGGQRQRIAIARALYKDAPILILDEATSALDNESEKQIQTALEKLKRNRTTLVIAHRLSTIENADKIIVLDKGKVVETGTHGELLNKGGYYASLHNAQAIEPA